MIDVRPREYERLPRFPGGWQHIMPPACSRDGCVYGKQVQDGHIFFIHDSPRRFSMMHIGTEKLADIEYDILDEIYPWIERLHAEDGA